MVLVPQVVDAVDIPVIAAGGVADGRGVIAAFALGAEGVQVGTRFVCATESPAHEAYKEAIIKATDRSTVITGRTTGHPVRCIKNKLTKKFDELESKGASIEELEALGTGRLRAAVIEGDIEWGSVMAGQSAGMVKKIQPAAEIIKDLFSDAERVLRQMQSYLLNEK